MKIMEETKKFLFVLFVEKQILVYKQISMTPDLLSQPNITNYIMIFIETIKQMIRTQAGNVEKTTCPQIYSTHDQTFDVLHTGTLTLQLSKELSRVS